MDENRYNSYENEMEIDLIDMMFYLLKKWRGLLLAVIIGAVVGTGFYVVKNRQQQAEQRAENKQFSALQNFHHKLFPLPFQHEYDRQDILLGNGLRDRRHNGIVGERQFSIFRNRPR